MPALAKVRKYALVASTALRSRWSYPADIFGIMLGYGLFVSVFSQLWQVGIAQKAVAGYDAHQLTWYFIIAELAVFGTGSQAFNGLSADIKSGQVAYRLARPWSYPLMALSDGLASAFSLVLPFAAVGLGVGLAVTGSVPLQSLLQTACWLLSLMLSLVLLVLFQLLLSFTAFWVEENAAFLWIHMKLALVLGTFLPLEFLPAGWRPWVEATPYGWLAYPPSKLFARWDQTQALGLLAGQVFWTGVLAGAVWTVFAAARRRTIVQGG